MALREGQWRVNASVVRSVLGVAGTGKQQLAVTFEYDEEGRRRLITSYHFFTDAALPWTVEALRAMGWDPEQNDWDVLSLDDTDLLRGREVVLVLEDEEYPVGSGQYHTKVRFVNAAGGAGVERLAPDEAKAFASDLRRRLMKTVPPKVGAGSSARPAASSSGNSSRADDLNLDDIPF